VLALCICLCFLAYAQGQTPTETITLPEYAETPSPSPDSFTSPTESPSFSDISTLIDTPTAYYAVLIANETFLTPTPFESSPNETSPTPSATSFVEAFENGTTPSPLPTLDYVLTPSPFLSPSPLLSPSYGMTPSPSAELSSETSPTPTDTLFPETSPSPTNFLSGNEASPSPSADSSFGITATPTSEVATPSEVPIISISPSLLGTPLATPLDAITPTPLETFTSAFTPSSTDMPTPSEYFTVTVNFDVVTPTVRPTAVLVSPVDRRKAADTSAIAAFNLQLVFRLWNASTQAQFTSALSDFGSIPLEQLVVLSVRPGPSGLITTVITMEVSVGLKDPTAVAQELESKVTSGSDSSVAIGGFVILSSQVLPPDAPSSSPTPLPVSPGAGGGVLGVPMLAGIAGGAAAVVLAVVIGVLVYRNRTGRESAFALSPTPDSLSKSSATPSSQRLSPPTAININVQPMITRSSPRQDSAPSPKTLHSIRQQQQQQPTRALLGSVRGAASPQQRSGSPVGAPAVSTQSPNGMQSFKGPSGMQSFKGANGMQSLKSPSPSSPQQQQQQQPSAPSPTQRIAVADRRLRAALGSQRAQQSFSKMRNSQPLGPPPLSPLEEDKPSTPPMMPSLRGGPRPAEQQSSDEQLALSEIEEEGPVRSAWLTDAVRAGVPSSMSIFRRPPPFLNGVGRHSNAEDSKHSQKQKAEDILDLYDDLVSPSEVAADIRSKQGTSAAAAAAAMRKTTLSSVKNMSYDNNPAMIDPQRNPAQMWNDLRTFSHAIGMMQQNALLNGVPLAAPAQVPPSIPTNAWAVGPMPMGPPQYMQPPIYQQPSIQQHPSYIYPLQSVHTLQVPPPWRPTYDAVPVPGSMQEEEIELAPPPHLQAMRPRRNFEREALSSARPSTGL